MRRTAALVALVVTAMLGALIGGVVGAEPASAIGGVSQASFVSAIPGKKTPNINDGTTLAIMQVGSWIVLGGTFTSVSPAGVKDGTQALSRPNVLAFDATTGVVDSTFHPAVDGTVWDAWPGPAADTVYIAGAFNNVNGVKAKGIALLDLTTGLMVATFKPAALDGIVFSVRSSGGHLLIGGSFTKVAGVTHGGVASLNPTSGQLDPYVGIQLTGHHNDSGSGDQGAVGARKMAVSPDGSRLVVIGNFKQANGVLHDQVVNVLLGTTAAAVDPSWNTAAFTAYCLKNAFDTYMQDVDFSPDGTYYVIAATGGNGTNTDGTNSLCDTASRWQVGDTGTNVRPRWADYSGKDTISSVAVTGSVVYVGGHERWLNNPQGRDSAGPGAVPRPGLAALDPVSGVPLSWNPGRNPRGAGAAALLATSSGLYVGSDTTFIGNHSYYRGRIAYFPLAGGAAAPDYSTATLPADVYLAGAPAGTNALVERSFTGSSAGTGSPVTGTGIDWSRVRGAVLVGRSVYYGSSDGNLYVASFDGTAFGAPTLVDPYDDPVWDDVDTGSGQTFQGAKPLLYGAEMTTVTSMFYASGRLYFTLSGKSALYSRSFSPQSGIVTEDETHVGGADLSHVSGGFLAGSTYYYASNTDGSLHSVTFDGSSMVSGSDHVVTGTGVSGVDWRAGGMFAFSGTSGTRPTAAFSSSCTGATCSFNASASSPAGLTYAWDFGDGAHASGVTTSHTYVTSGTKTVTLTVTATNGGTASVSHQVVPTLGPAPTAAFTSSCALLVCHFDATGSAGPTGGIAAYSWAFGDGGSTTGVTPTHTYAAAGSFTVTLTVTDGVGQLGTTSHQVVVTAAVPGSKFTAVTPCRVFDTRSGTGTCAGIPTPAVTKATLPPDGTITVALTGVAGIPSTATAVVLSVTAVHATTATFITVWPAGALRPSASNLNVANAFPKPNLVVVPLGTGGKVSLYNHTGTVDLVADLAGYFAPAASSTYTALPPCRVLDTRYGTGGCTGLPSPAVPKQPLGAGTTLKVHVTGVGGVPANATAVVLNVTAVRATSQTFVTAYPDGATLPVASNLNVSSASAVGNLVVVPVGTGGLVDLYNHIGTVDLVVDLAGYFAPSAGPTFHAVGPCRAFDTRTGQGACSGAVAGIVPKAPVGPGQTIKVTLLGVGGIPTNATAVVLNLAAANATAGTFVTVFPDGGSKPNASSLNVSGAFPTANLVIVQLGAGRAVDLVNNAGSVDLIGDLAGYFAP